MSRKHTRRRQANITESNNAYFGQNIPLIIFLVLDFDKGGNQDAKKSKCRIQLCERICERQHSQPCTNARYPNKRTISAQASPFPSLISPGIERLLYLESHTYGEKVWNFFIAFTFLIQNYDQTARGNIAAPCHSPTSPECPSLGTAVTRGEYHGHGLCTQIRHT